MGQIGHIVEEGHFFFWGGGGGRGLKTRRAVDMPFKMTIDLR